MPQEIGQSFKSVIPTLADDSSIEEAFYMYHYGNAFWTTGQPIPSNSIEGILSSLEARITDNENSIQNLSNTYIATSPSSTDQNIIQATSALYVPLTVRGASGQTANLQEWVVDTGSSLITKARISANGSFSTLGYLSIGSINISSSVANRIQIASPTHRGIVIRSASSQSANLQEWQDNSGNILLSVDQGGSFVYNVPVEDAYFISVNQPPTPEYLLLTVSESSTGKTFILNESSSRNAVISINTNSTSTDSIGTQISFINFRDSEVEFQPSGSTILRSENNYRKIDGKYSAATLIKVSSNEWVLLGALKS